MIGLDCCTRFQPAIRTGNIDLLFFHSCVCARQSLERGCRLLGQVIFPHSAPSCEDVVDLVCSDTAGSSAEGTATSVESEASAAASVSVARPALSALSSASAKRRSQIPKARHSVVA